MIARTALHALAVLAGAFWLVLATAPAAYACGLTYVAVDPVKSGCASTAPALASAVAAVSAFVAAAVVTVGNYQAGDRPLGIQLRAYVESIPPQFRRTTLANPNSGWPWHERSRPRWLTRRSRSF